MSRNQSLEFLNNSENSKQNDELGEFSSKLMFAHFNTKELVIFDQLQGGKAIVYLDPDDPETGFREYSKLLLVFSNPVVRELFEAELKSFEKSDLKSSKSKALLKGLVKISEPREYERAPGDYNPIARQIIADGQNGDNDIALMPIAVLDYFDSLLGKPSINPIDGLPQYGGLFGFVKDFFRSPGNAISKVVRNTGKVFKEAQDTVPALGPLAQLGVGLATAGASLPAQLAAQAATAGGLSRLAGNKYGNVFKDAAIAGIVHGAGHLATGAGYGVGARAGIKGATDYGSKALLRRNPTFSGALMTGIGDLALNGYNPNSGIGGVWDNFKGNVGGLFSFPGASGAPSAGISATAGAPYGSAALAAGPSTGLGVSSLPAAALQGAPASGSGLLGSLGGLLGGGAAGGEGMLSMGTILPLAAIGGLLFKGKKDSDKGRRKAKADAQQETQEAVNMVRGHAEKEGHSEPLKYELNNNNIIANPEPPSARDIYEGKQHAWFLTPEEFAEQNRRKAELRPHYSGGGLVHRNDLIKGPGKGQDDYVDVDLHEGAYVVPADAVSKLGDGSTEAGNAEWDRIIAKVDQMKRGNTRNMPSPKIVPVSLSNGEKVINPSVVTRLGNNSNKVGAELIKSLIQNIRADKSRKSGGLPAKSKDGLVYLNKVMGRS